MANIFTGSKRAGNVGMEQHKHHGGLRIPHLARFASIAAMLVAGIAFSPPSLRAAPTCPLSYGTTDTAKSNKLYLYFPTADDATFPAYGAGVSPARTFDVAGLTSTIGTTAALRDRIYDVVADDYCEFNVQVLQTTTNPATLTSPPARRVTVAVGSDVDTAWGLAQEVDTGDPTLIDFARVWAGTYTTCEGGDGSGGCSATGALTGANATLDRWAQAIGGTAAHEAGHTYGLAHSDDNPNTGLCGDLGPAPLPGEDSFRRHLMPSGCNLNGNDRASYRRHISNRTYSLLATNVGLSVQTMHNWDLVNPNSSDASSLVITFLSPLPTVTLTWSWTGTSSPWINPTVSGPSGTATFKGATYNVYQITWSTPNPAWTGGTPGILPGGAEFHIGATFTGVDFNQPDPIIIQDVTLRDASSNALTLHPRLPMYDTGAVDAADGTFAVHFFAGPSAGPPLLLQSAVIYQLPQVASIESMVGAGRPFSFDKQRIRPWGTGRRCQPGRLRETIRCPIAKVSDRPHVRSTHKVGEWNVYDCSKGVPRIDRPVARQDSRFVPDYDGPICAGTSRDPFPATTVYILATFVDPKARHYDMRKREYVVGPVTSKLYYQFAGIRDLRRLDAHQGKQAYGRHQ